MNRFLLFISLCFATHLSFSQYNTSQLTHTANINQAVETANSCAETILRKYEKKINQGKKLPVNPTVAANECVQNAFNEYIASSKIKHTNELNNDSYIIASFWEKVNAESSFLDGLYNLEN